MQASRPKTTFISAKEIKESLVTVERGSEHSCICKWEIQKYKKLKAKSVCSPIFEVGGFAFRLVIDPKGANIHDRSRHCSLLLHILNPGGLKFNCFASFKLTLVNQVNESKSFHNEFYYRFSRKNQYYGTHYSNWKEIANSEFLSSDGSLLVFVDICVLDETISFLNNDQEEPSTSTSVSSSSVFNGKFTWKIKNYSLFKEKIKTQKVFSPGFHVGNQSSLRFGFREIEVNGVGLLQLTLELKDILKSMRNDQSCWSMFKVSVLNQIQGLKHMHFDSYGRFYWDGLYECSASIKISDFIEPDKGFLVDDTVTFTVSFNAIKELMVGPVPRKFDLVMKCDLANEYVGTFKWKIDTFRRLKDHLKKKKITGLCVRSKSFQIGNQNFRLLVYPRGQSQEPSHLSMFLEVLDAQNTSGDQSCFVNYQLSVVNQKNEDKSVTKESQNRSSKAMKDWGWSEFMALNSLYDQDSGYLVLGTAVFTAEVRILKEKLVVHDITELRDTDRKGKSIIWKMENFLSFKEIMATQKIFSKSFEVGVCELRIGVYVSVDTIYAYLECDPSVVIDPDKKFWASYRMAVVNQKDPAKTLWQKSFICTKTSMNSVLQIMKLSDMLEANAGFVVREMVIFGCEILDYHSEQEEARQAEISNIVRENAILLGKLSKSEAATERYKSEMSREEEELSEKLQAAETRFKQFLSEQEEQIGKLLEEKKVDQDRLGNVKKQLSWLKSQKRDELEKAVEEKNVLAERLKSAEAEKKRFDKELKTYHTQEEVKQSLLDEFRQLKQEVKQIKGEKREKEEEVARCEEYTEELEANLDACQQRILSRQVSLENQRLLLDSLKALNDLVSEGDPEPGQGPQSAEKISLLLDKAPKQLLPDLITLLPKLVNHSELLFVACALLDQFQRPDAEPALLPPAYSHTCYLGSFQATEHSMSSASECLSRPCLFISNPALPYYDLYFPHDDSTLRIDFNISHCIIVGHCSITGWILMVFQRRVGYYNVRTRQTLLLPDLPEDVDPTEGIYGCFTSTPHDELNFTMLMIHSIITLTIYRYSQIFGTWIRDELSSEPQRACAHTKLAGAFCWVDELSGTLNLVRDWASGGELNWEMTQLGNDFMNCLNISSVLCNTEKYLLTLSYDFNFNVYELRFHPPNDIEVISCTDLNGMNFYTVSDCTGVAVMPQSLVAMMPQSHQVSNMLHVASYLDSDCIKCKINDEEDQEIEEIKTCPFPVGETCECRAAWFWTS